MLWEKAPIPERARSDKQRGISESAGKLLGYLPPVDSIPLDHHPAIHYPGVKRVDISNRVFAATTPIHRAIRVTRRAGPTDIRHPRA